MAQARDILEKLGATFQGDEDAGSLDATKLDLASVFGGDLAGEASLSLFSAEAFGFTAPPELAALGPLWIAGLDKPKQVVSAVRDAHKRLQKRLDEEGAALEHLGFEAAPVAPEPVARGIGTIQGHSVVVTVDGGGLLLARVDGAPVPDGARELEYDVADADTDAVTVAIGERILALQNDGKLPPSKGAFEAATVRGAELASASGEGSGAKRRPPRPRRKSQASREGDAASAEAAPAASPSSPSPPVDSPSAEGAAAESAPDESPAAESAPDERPPPDASSSEEPSSEGAPSEDASSEAPPPEARPPDVEAAESADEAASFDDEPTRAVSQSSSSSPTAHLSDIETANAPVDAPLDVEASLAPDDLASSDESSAEGAPVDDSDSDEVALDIASGSGDAAGSSAGAAAEEDDDEPAAEPPLPAPDAADEAADEFDDLDVAIGIGAEGQTQMINALSSSQSAGPSSADGGALQTAIPDEAAHEVISQEEAGRIAAAAVASVEDEADDDDDIERIAAAAAAEAVRDDAALEVDAVTAPDPAEAAREDDALDAAADEGEALDDAEALDAADAFASGPHTDAAARGDDASTALADGSPARAANPLDALASVVGEGISTGKTGAIALDAEAFAVLRGEEGPPADDEVAVLREEIASLESEAAEFEARANQLREKAAKLRERLAQSAAAPAPQHKRSLAEKMRKMRERSFEGEPSDEAPDAPADEEEGVRMQDVAAVLDGDEGGPEPDEATVMAEAAGFDPQPDDADDDEEDVFAAGPEPAADDDDGAFAAIETDGATRVAASPLEASAPRIALVLKDPRARGKLKKVLEPRVGDLLEAEDAQAASALDVDALVFVRPPKSRATVAGLAAVKERAGDVQVLVLSPDESWAKAPGVDLRLALAQRPSEVADQVVEGLTQLGVALPH